MTTTGPQESLLLEIHYVSIICCGLTKKIVVNMLPQEGFRPTSASFQFV